MMMMMMKSSCMRIGPRNDNMCAKLTKCDGSELSWVDEIRHLCVFIARSRKFKCCVDNAKRSFYRAANKIFGKVGRLASEEVVVQLLLHRCMPVLLYALEVCALHFVSVYSAYLFT